MMKSFKYMLAALSIAVLMGSVSSAFADCGNHSVRGGMDAAERHELDRQENKAK